MRAKPGMVAALLLTVSRGPLLGQQPRDMAAYLMADRSQEIALARSAAPHEVSDSASVLVLTPNGFVEAAHGSNGFVCVVLRSFAGGVEDPDFFDSRIRGPACFNPPGARTALAAMLRQMDAVMKGTPPAQIPDLLARAYAAGDLLQPANGAMTYMLSPLQYLDPEHAAHHWKPHLMFFYDRGEPAALWGAGGFSAPIINGSAADPHAPFLTLLVPTRRWADGTPASP